MSDKKYQDRLIISFINDAYAQLNILYIRKYYRKLIHSCIISNLLAKT